MDDKIPGLKFEEADLAADRPVKYFIRTFKTRHLIRLHYHNSLEINVCRGIEGMLRLETGEIDLCDDSLLLLPPGLPHSYRLEQSGGTIEVYHLLTSGLPGIDEALPVFNGMFSLPLTDCPDEALELLKVFRDPNLTVLRYSGSLLLFTDLLLSGGTGPAIQPPAGAFLRRVIDFAERNYSGTLSLDDVSGHVGLSRYHFSRKFREKTGETWSDYLRAVRLAKAQRMLAAGAGVGETADACGFESDSYFIRCFREAWSVTPLQYRNRMSGKSNSAPDY